MADELDFSDDSSDFRDDDLNTPYPQELLRGLKDLQEQKQLCDVTIVVGERAFHAHKAVLAACSKYFFAMFTSGFKERNESEIKIEGSAEIFEILLKFAYTGHLHVAQRADRMCEVLEMACYMQFKECALKCSKSIVDLFRFKDAKVSVSDACKLSILARIHDYQNVVRASEKYLESKVEELKETDVFLQDASVLFLQEFLCRKGFSSEVQVLEMIVSWLQYDWENRRIHSHQLLRKIRLGLIPPEDLKELLGPEILEIPECLDLVNHVLELQVSEKSKRTLSLENPEIFATRSTITAPISTYVDEGKTKFCYYSISKHEWIDLKCFDTLQPISSQAMLVVDGTLYAAGGFVEREEYDIDLVEYLNNGESYGYVNQKEFCCYQAEENKWHSLLPMNEARSSFSMVHLDGFIYAIGGASEDEDIESYNVERYDITKKEWEDIESLPDGFREISTVVFKGKILVYGVIGVPRNNNLFKHVLMVYHPNSGHWQTIVLIESSPQTKTLYIPPVLYVYKEKCYRVLYRTKKHSLRVEPSVQRLHVTCEADDKISVKFGRKIQQYDLPKGYTGFYIKGDVFINKHKFVWYTGISTDEFNEVDLDQLRDWENFESSDEPSCTLFTFDRKQLEK